MCRETTQTQDTHIITLPYSRKKRARSEMGRRRSSVCKYISTTHKTTQHTCRQIYTPIESWKLRRNCSRGICSV